MNQQYVTVHGGLKLKDAAISSAGRVVVSNWNENQISGTVPDGSAVKMHVYLSGQSMATVESNTRLFDFSPSAFSVQTNFFPAACLADICITIEHQDGALTTLLHAAARSGTNAIPNSLFGGMWIDRPDWTTKLEEKVARGEVMPALAARIKQFVSDGYTVFEGAVSQEVIGNLNAELQSAWDQMYPGMKMEVYSLPDHPVAIVDIDKKYYGETHKLLDTYAFIPVAQEATTPPSVVEFLTAIFEDTPKAFQQLTFEWGSQQAIHKDTAYVKIDGNPMSMLASWLALEDVSEGTGELEYYVGSHRAPDYVFGSLSKWMEAEPEKHDDFLASLHSDSARYSQPLKRFLPKAGDVLIWHADLAHGGSPVTRPGVTRRSLVTHFTAAGNAPFYERWCKLGRLSRGGIEFVSSYSNVVGYRAAGVA